MAARTLYCTATHTWLRLHREAASGGLLAARSAWRAELGLTQRGCDDLGDVVAALPLAGAGGRVAAGAELLRLSWEAHSVSTADELYHTTWGILERDHVIRSPLPATLLELCAADAASGTLEPTQVLATLHIDRPALQASSLVDEARYLAHVSRLPPGQFADYSLHEQHSIGGHAPAAGGAAA